MQFNYESAHSELNFVEHIIFPAKNDKYYFIPGKSTSELSGKEYKKWEFQSLIYIVVYLDNHDMGNFMFMIDTYLSLYFLVGSIKLIFFILFIWIMKLQW